MFGKLYHLIAGGDPLTLWLVLFVASGIVAGVWTGYFRARKIQQNKFNWPVFRHEIIFAIVSLTVSAFTLGSLSKFLQSRGIITFNHEHASGWVIAGEYALYFIGFDTYFYWLHRLMHIEPIYTWIHKIHHKSISPNLLTTLSVNPLESLINGGFVPLFTALLVVHDSTMAFIGPTNVIMGFYVHSGFEFFPRWWNKTWLTKWFITATFHDQHHRFFTGNYGGYTTVWDRICGTMRKKFEADFEKVTTRPLKQTLAAAE
jgi:sterol desaturase/sphingolipid hydroxylase (fatty acid hydroxylase superfamily)